jgi:MFS family permease
VSEPKDLREFRRAGHLPTLFCAFLYFAISCMVLPRSVRAHDGPDRGLGHSVRGRRIANPPLGGYLSDRLGGIRVLTWLYLGVAATMAGVSFLPPLGPCTLLLVTAMALLGMGNGAVFQLVAKRFPRSDRRDQRDRRGRGGGSGDSCCRTSSAACGS